MKFFALAACGSPIRCTSRYSNDESSSVPEGAQVDGSPKPEPNHGLRAITTKFLGTLSKRQKRTGGGSRPTVVVDLAPGERQAREPVAMKMMMVSLASWNLCQPTLTCRPREGWMAQPLIQSILVLRTGTRIHLGVGVEDRVLLVRSASERPSRNRPGFCPSMRGPCRPTKVKVIRPSCA